ncbi:MAG: WecB/TagA/CpsF family glycosyltransferase [Candidatus Andersenbacteria bacterium]
MSENLQLGHVTCNYTATDEFLEQAKTWLSEDTFHHVVTLNPEMVLLAEHDARFREAVGAAELRVPDGSGLIWARWYLRSEFWSLLPSLVAFSFRSAERVSGVDLVTKLSELALQAGESVYLLGGTVYQNTHTRQYLNRKFPELSVHASPHHTFDVTGPESILQDIQEKKPSVLFVAYGAPKQSVWIETHRKNLPSVRIAVGVGGAFAILSEDRPRAPHFFRKRNLEWLWRLLLEPSRLPRIWNAVVRFPAMVHRQKTRPS